MYLNKEKYDEIEIQLKQAFKNLSNTFHIREKEKFQPLFNLIEKILLSIDGVEYGWYLAYIIEAMYSLSKVMKNTDWFYKWYDWAIEKYEEELKDSPATWAQYLALKGYAYYTEEKKESGSEWFEMAYSIIDKEIISDPTNVYNYIKKAHIMLWERRFDETLDMLSTPVLFATDEQRERLNKYIEAAGNHSYFIPYDFITRW